MNSKSKFTPGPWIVSGSRHDGLSRIVSTKTNTIIAETCPPNACDFRNDEELANAALIAAAPDQHAALLTVSEGINAMIDNWAHWTDEQIRAHLFHLQEVAQVAYNKAEGK